MASAVLGKRHRVCIAPDTRCNTATRSGKRVCIESGSGENAILGIVEDFAQSENSIEVDDVAGPSSNDTDDTSPLKHVSRLPLSQSKENTVRGSSLSDVSRSQVSTPKTSRHRDALSQKAPVTPRHHFTTTTSFTPRTPRTPAIPRSIYNDARKIFTRGSNPGPLIGRERERKEATDFVGRLVESASGGCLYVSGPPGTGKSALISEICQTVKDTSEASQSYVNCMSIQNASDIFNILASELGITDDIFGSEAKGALQDLFTNASSKRVSLVVLDEVDQLLNLDIDVLYTLFEWSLLPASKLLLIGIANALDFTDRFLPRLKARNLKPRLLPFLPYTAPEIAFILKVRARSLLSADTSVVADFTPLLHPAAIQLISKKVATQNGDLRKAFDITKRALDVVEQDTKEKFRGLDLSMQSPISSSKKTPLAENNNLSSPVSMNSASLTKPVGTSDWHDAFTQLTAESAPRVTLAHVARVTTVAFNNGTSSRLKGLNLQQKAVLCSLVALEEKNQRFALVSTPPTTPSKKRKDIFPASKAIITSQSTGAPTIRALFDAYAVLCSRDNVIHALSNTEFCDVVGTLESLSLVTAVDGKTSSFNGTKPITPSRKGRGGFGTAVTADQRKLSSCVGLQELETAVEGAGSDILKAILSGEGF